MFFKASSQICDDRLHSQTIPGKFKSEDEEVVPRAEESVGGGPPQTHGCVGNAGNGL